MAVRIANLKILISANTRGLAGDFTKTGKRVNRFKGQVTSLRGSVGKFLGPLKAIGVGLLGLAGITISVGAAIQALRVQFTELDKLGKTASKIGVLTDGLQKMRFAAKLSGVAVTTTDMALQRFRRRTAEAAVGTGEALKAFKELNINAADFAKLSLEDQMKDLADAMQRFSDSDQLRIAFKLFDSEGAALVNTLKGGSEALDEIFAERASLGLFTPQQIAQIESANDTMSKLGIQINFVAGSIAAELSPAIDELVSRFVELGKTGEFESGRITSAMKELALNVALVVDGVKEFGGTVIRTAAQSTELLVRTAGVAFDAFSFASDRLGFRLNTSSQREVTSFFDAVEDRTAAIAINLRDANRSVGGFGAFRGFSVSAAGGDGVSLTTGITAAIAGLPAALEEGTAGAFSFSARAGQAKGIDTIAKFTKQSAEEAVEQTAILERIEDNFVPPLREARL